MGGDLMAVTNRISGDPRRRCHSTATGIQRCANPAPAQHVPDPGPACARPILEMALHAQITVAFHRLDRLIDMLIPRIARSEGQLSPLLDVDDNRDSQTRVSRPADGRSAAAITFEIAPAHAGPAAPMNRQQQQ